MRAIQSPRKFDDAERFAALRPWAIRLRDGCYAVLQCLNRLDAKTRAQALAAERRTSVESVARAAGMSATERVERLVAAMAGGRG